MSRSWEPPANAARESVGSDMFDRLHMDSKLQAARPHQHDRGEPVATPVYLTSVYKNTSVQQYLDILAQSGYIYQRLGNPTVEAAELAINQMERGAGTLLYNSGLAAINAVFLCFLKAGDHLVCQSPCYSGTQTFITGTLMKFGVTVSWVKAGGDMQSWADAVRDQTQMIYAESPSNPNMQLCDMEALAELGQKHGIKTVVDGTFATPIIQTPIEHGIDISIHSCSKYIGGHSDLIGGCATTRSLQDWKALKFQMNNTGLAMAPFEAALAHRGVKTLSLRVRRQSHSAMAIALYLHNASSDAAQGIVAVHYPGLQSHGQHELAKRQLNDGLFGGMLAFEMHSSERARRVVESVKLISLSVSLGGTESLIEHPATMTHGPLFKDEASGPGSASGDETPPGLIRLSVGLEDANDLIDDLKRAFKAATVEAEP